MNEAQEILLKSLQSYGISLHSNIFSIKDLTPDSIFSICAQFLLLIDNDPSSSSCFPPSLPSSMVDRFKICEDMAAAIKALGYRETLSFHQFLYPSEEDSYKLVRFMVVKLSESSECRKGADDNLNIAHLVSEEATGDIAKATSNQQNERIEADEVVLSENNQITGQLGGSENATQLQYGCVDSCKKENYFCREFVGSHSEESRNPKEFLSFDGENVNQMENKFIVEPQEKLASLQVQMSKVITVTKSCHNHNLLKKTI